MITLNICLQSKLYFRFSTNVENGTKKLCRLLNKMKSRKLNNGLNEEVSALDSALNEDIETIAPMLSSMEDEVQLILDKEEEDRMKEEERKRKDAKDCKRLEREWRKRAEEIYIRKQKSKKTLDEMVSKIFQIKFLVSKSMLLGKRNCS